LGVWLNCSLAGAMVVMAALLFALAWMFSPSQGLIPRLLRRQTAAVEEPGVPEAPRKSALLPEI
jgi:manganese/zinc/iron transport system permease protein